MARINIGLISMPEAPCGGVKMSGVGGDGFRPGLVGFLELKYICMDGIDPAVEE